MSHQDFVSFIKHKMNEAHPSIILDGQGLVEIPAEIAKVNNLVWLMLSNNSISSIPKEIGTLKNLGLLDLSRNSIKELPEPLFNLHNLISLDLSNNQISAIPQSIKNLKELKRLNLSNNNLSQLPIEIGYLKNLEELILSGNQLDSIPSELEHIKSLVSLDLSANCIANLPPELCHLGRLKTLCLEGNDITSPPPAIVAQGIKGIMAFLRNLQASAVRRYETKLLLLGQGAVGKSSLLRRLRGLNFEDELWTTYGIDVAPLEIRHPDEIDVKVQINVWDFAGQEIEHATHQFFMSPYAVYALAWNSRHGHLQGRLDYWLERIKSHAPESPILLVATHRDEREPDINFESYKNNYPNLEASFSIDNKSGTGIPALKNAIANHASKLPQMGQLWPESWQKVEKQLQRIEDHHISYSEFKKVCFESGVNNEADIDFLSNTLHNLGIVLHFKDDTTLRDLVVLKPNWITKAISLALCDEQTRKLHGCLNHRDLPRIWKDYAAHLYPAFFSLMNKFELCYQIENSTNQSLIPALLPYKPPHFEAIEPMLKVIFRLSSIPAGLMSRFIVRTHRFTNDVHWREGAVLEYDGQVAKAELMEHDREFHLSVSGSNPTHFFSILIDTVNQILSNYPGLTVERRVPCTCQRGHMKECGHYFTYEELVRYAKRGKETIDCRVTLNDISVHSLLFGIHEISRGNVLSEVSEITEKIVLAEDFTILTEKQRQIVLMGQRSIIQEYNRLEAKDNRCPNLFMISPQGTEKFGIHLVCQCPEGWHLAGHSPTYVVENQEPEKQYLVPLLSESLPLLEYLVPLSGIDINLRSQVSKDVYTTHRAKIRYMREIVDKSVNTLGRIEAIQQALRQLYLKLEILDPEQEYAGLRLATTPDGYRVWLCPYHFSLLQPAPLQIMKKAFDVFLCHNSKDKSFVRKLNLNLQSKGVKSWFDEEQIFGGDRWQDSMAQGLRESACTVVCIGENDWGPWQYEELQVALSQAVGKGAEHLVIPLIIPPANSLPADTPAFLANRHAVRLSSLSNNSEMHQLIRSINNVKTRMNRLHSERI